MEMVHFPDGGIGVDHLKVDAAPLQE